MSTGSQNVLIQGLNVTTFADPSTQPLLPPSVKLPGLTQYPWQLLPLIPTLDTKLATNILASAVIAMSNFPTPTVTVSTNATATPSKASIIVSIPTPTASVPSAWPGDTNTGLIGATTVYGSTDFTCTSNGQTVSNWQINGRLIRNGFTNVVVSNCRIKGGCQDLGGNITLQDCDIGQDACAGYLNVNGNNTMLKPSGSGGYTLLRCNIHHWDHQDLMASHGGMAEVIKDCFIHSVCAYDRDETGNTANYDHYDMIQHYDPGTSGVNVIIDHCHWIENNAAVEQGLPFGFTNPDGYTQINFGDTPGAGTVEVKNCLFGGTYNGRVSSSQILLRLCDTNSQVGLVYNVHDNVWVTGSVGTTHSFPASSAYNGTTGYIWTNNKWDDNTPITA